MKMIISWGKDINRSTGLASLLDLECINIYSDNSIKYLKYFNYFKYLFSTIKLVRRNSPRLLILVGPPTLIFYTVLYIRLFVKREMRVVLDCHNGILRSEWKRIPLVGHAMREADLVLTHNDNVKNKVDSEFRVDSYVLGDPILDVFPSETMKSKKNGLKTIMIPCSFREDEPIEFIFDICHSLSRSYEVKVTGGLGRLKDRGITIPEQILECFTGFIPREKYDNLMRKSYVVVCLTTDDDIQMCAINESISFDKPFIHSNTLVLNQLYGELDLAIIHRIESITMKLKELDARYEDVGTKLGVFKENYQATWQASAEEIGLI